MPPEVGLKTLRDSLLKVSGLSGEACLQRMVEALPTSFGATFAFVGVKLPGTEPRVRTLAGWGPQGPIEPFTYDLTGSPCEQVLGRSACFFLEGVQTLFPRDHDLVAMGIEAYLGQPIYGSDGRMLGLVNVLSRTPMIPSPDALLILDVFAARAGVEVERMLAEEARCESELLLQRLDRMNALAELGAGLVQELKGALTLVIDYAALLASDLADGTEPRPSDLAVLQDSARRAATLVDGLEAFGHPNVEPAQTFDAGRRLHHIHGLLRPILPPHIELGVEVQAVELPIVGDPGQLDLVIGTLVLRCREALPNGGKVMLRGRREVSQVSLEVWETGPADRSEPSMGGLGPAGVEGLIRQMGARLELSCDDPTTRCFRMLIPV